MRLFTAVLPPPEAMTELSAAVAAVRNGGALPQPPGLRWSEPAGWHVTVAYYGEVADDRLPGLRERLAAAAAARPPFGLRLAGGGTFGERVLWAGLAGETAALHALSAAAAEAGPAVDQYDAYRPHLTLALGTRGESTGPPLGPLAAALGGFASRPFRVERLVLMASEPERGFSVRAAWPLGVP
ncbi:RNA 2',3'-cyclic phosphodiesterase [Streptomyces johnsoniae]|uniref:RNA 2',3'-cyclic phosphodiesterase n=1 Tax=Streptomyces johnsoniae TaxID=3075532 RepID=A0ABU2RYS3_9ACTN|nr:RNA 2',3'-cyclic phosphodiesterase [Streptomyces sp. DSM 41886]MDT0441906.1 RNA 2',3'-cyclic phosphodiesterase [Streptomyces sp. DSM 41886]